jgi:hypothetical protein
MKKRQVMVSLVIVVSLALASPTVALGDPPVPLPSPSATPVSAAPAPAPIINLIFHWDFGVIGEAVQKALQDVFGGIAEGIQQHIFAPITQSSLNFLTQTPPSGTYANATVMALWGYTRAVASLGFVVVLVISGYSIMLGRATATPFADALVTLRDATLGLLLANTSLWWTALAIDLGNSLTGGIGTVALPDVASTGFVGSALETIFLGLVYLILGILLVLQMLMRLALLDVLLILAPLAVLVGMVPQGRHWGRLWTDLFVGTVLTQFVQILALRLGTGLMTQLVPTLADSVLTFLAGIAVLWLVLKLPGLLNVGLHRAGGSTTLLGTALAYRGISRVLSSGGTASVARTAATAAGGISTARVGTPLTSSSPAGASSDGAPGGHPILRGRVTR